MKKKTFNILITSMVCILLVGCNQKDTEQNEYFIYGSHVNLNDELRESLFKCLEKEKIEYKLDNKKNVLIKKKDNDAAIVNCA